MRARAYHPHERGFIMAVVKGRGVRIELGATYSTAAAATAVTLANPGVVTANAHGMLDGAVGYFDAVSGMVQLEGQAFRVDNPAANTFELQGINTLAMSAYVSGTFIKVLTWLTLAEATSYEITGGTAEKLDVTTLIDTVRKQENGLLGAASLNMNVLAQTIPSTAMLLVQSAAQAGTKLAVRITHPDGAVRIALGEPSSPGENVGQGAVGTGTLEFSVKGAVLLLGA